MFCRYILPTTAASQREEDTVQYLAVIHPRATAFAFVLTRQERRKHRPLLARESSVGFGVLFHNFQLSAGGEVLKWVLVFRAIAHQPSELYANLHRQEQRWHRLALTIAVAYHSYTTFELADLFRYLSFCNDSRISQRVLDPMQKIRSIAKIKTRPASAAFLSVTQKWCATATLGGTSFSVVCWS